MSDWKTVCDAIATDLTGNIPALAGVKVHKLAPWTPEQAIRDQDRHLGIWPGGDVNPATLEAEDAQPSTNFGHQLNQTYYVMYWEPSETEVTRGLLDEPAAESLMDLQNAIRDRFYVEANQTLGGSALVWYGGSTFPDRAGPIRWFAVQLLVVRFQAFTS